MAVAEVDPDVLDAFLRLVELLEKPKQIPVLAPMIIREIHYRLLIGPQGERFANGQHARHAKQPDCQEHHMVEGQLQGISTR